MSTSLQVFLFTARPKVGPGLPAYGQSLSPCGSERLEQKGSEGRAGAMVLVSRGALWRRGPPEGRIPDSSGKGGAKTGRRQTTQYDGVMG